MMMSRDRQRYRIQQAQTSLRSTRVVVGGITEKAQGRALASSMATDRPREAVSRLSTDNGGLVRSPGGHLDSAQTQIRTHVLNQYSQFVELKWPG